ncbi:MAG: TM2 domain-containing protein [Akkermansia sp.]|nr:TM2 domain-containing protein [Akkermansia sp.]
MDAGAGMGESRKRGWVALLLLLLGFVGLNGMQRFYLGRVWTGMLQLVTLGGLGLWQLADAVLLALEVLRDGAGKRVLLTRCR